MDKTAKLSLLIFGIIAAAVLIRLLPHPYNFTPIGALALFGGRFIRNKLYAFGVPVLAMLLSDLVIGFHNTMVFVYGAFLLILGVGVFLRRYSNYLSVVPAAFVSSLVFFIVSNLGVWFVGGLYTKSLEGLVQCFVAALPFYHWTLAGNFFYAGAFFGIYALAENSLKKAHA